MNSLYEKYLNEGYINENGIKLIYEDNHMIALVKDPGLLSQEDISKEDDILNLLKADLRIRYQKTGEAFVGLVHRLDRNTGGTMVFAKTSKAASRLSLQLREKTFKKGYFAIVEGQITSKEGTLRNTIKKNESLNKMYEDKRGKEAITRYSLVDTNDGTSLLYLEPITGRTHQIRVQLSLFGHPIIGDVKYGYREELGHEIGLWSCCVQCKHVTKEINLLFQSFPMEGEIWKAYPKDIYTNYLDKRGKMYGFY